MIVNFNNYKDLIDLDALKRAGVNTLTLSRAVSAAYIFNKGFKINIKEYLIIAALFGMTDFLDGHLARKWKVESKFGMELDTITDIILNSFLGVAWAKDNLKYEMVPYFTNLIIMSSCLITGNIDKLFPSKSKGLKLIDASIFAYRGIIIFGLYPAINYKLINLKNQNLIVSGLTLPMFLAFIINWKLRYNSK